MAASSDPKVSLRRVRADAFRDAALAEADMRRAVDALEPLLGAATDSADLYLMLDQLNAQAAELVGDALLPVLDTVRSRVLEILRHTVTESVRAALAVSPEAGRHAWLSCYAEALMSFREPLTRHLFDARLSVAFPDADRLAQLAGWTDDLHGQRWARVRPLLDYLVGASQYSTRLRVNLLVSAGEVALYWQGDRAGAKRCFDIAMEVGPKEPRAWEGTGDYLRAEGDLDGAEQAFRQAVEVAPESGTAHRRLGEVAEDRDDLESAERHYLLAVANRAWNSDGHRALIAFYSHPRMYERRKGRIAALAAQANAAEPVYRYDTLVFLGAAYRDNREFELARMQFRAAIYLHPQRSGARTALADLYRLEGDLERAERDCRWVLGQEPGYWPAVYQLAKICEDRHDWERAIAHYERTLAYRPPYMEPDVYGGIAMAHLGAERQAQAAAVALDGLRAIPGSAYLLQVAAEIAQRMIEAEGEQAAEQLLRQVRDVKGESYEAEYQRSRGQLYYEHGDFPRAATAYERAISADATRADYHRDVARAYRDAHDWSRAREALERALELDQDEELYRDELGSLLNREANRLSEEGRYAEAADGYRGALELLPDDAVIHSNLALVLEWGRWPGRMAVTLREAVAAITRAEELSGDPGYKVRRSKLEWLEGLVGRYGELVATPAMGIPVRVAISRDLVPLVDPAEGGRTFMYEDVPVARDRVREEIGYPLPGFRFRDDPDLGPGGFTVSIHEVEVARGAAEDESDLLEQVVAVVRRHAWRLLGIDQAEQWLAEAAPSLAPRARLAATRVLRALARDGVPLTPRVAEYLVGSEELKSAPAPIVRQVRLALRDTLPGNAEGTASAPVPQWLEAKARQLPLGSADEHRLATDLRSLLPPGARTTLVTSESELRPWLQRFTEGAIGPGQSRCAGVLEHIERADDG
ncbi:tetratricopeptide repeat protein [Streptomyces sp. 21So2-11]|uniref:tetratricopeptide repeat protein n=1 Tax=Streptomyces sp. 21So2-11 TaxID=3144408 RepID=UPI00321B12A1